MNRLLTLSLSSIAVLAFAMPEEVSAQAALQRNLEGATRLECAFPTLVTSDWVDGAGKAEVTESGFEAVFFDINVDEGTAEAEGRFGESYIVVRYSNGYLHLMQSLFSGPLYVTTVIARESKDGRLLAVHTRHEYTPTRLPGFTSRPEMYVGDCAIVKDEAG